MTCIPVQRDQFEEFLAPELGKYGYEALYKIRAQEMWTGDPRKIDGCAIFFHKHRFSRVRKYEDNVALIIILEENRVTDNPGEHHSVCLANVHLDSDRDHTDVKLWQVHILLKGLEKIAVNAKIPVLMCVDINSHPNSVLYDLLTKGIVDELHPDLLVDMVVDPFHFLNPASKMNHELPLVNTYSTFKAYRYQQHRWSCGTANLFRKIFWDIIEMKISSLW